MDEDLAQVVASINRPAEDDSTPVAIESFKAVSSYNLINDVDNPSLLVPG